MRDQITARQLPRNGTGAFLPIRAVIPSASSNGLLRSEAYPGTLRVPAPAPAAVEGAANGNGSSWQGSFAGGAPGQGPVPDYFCPAIQIIHADNCHPPVRVFSDNAMPVPTENVARIPKDTAYKPRIGGRTATRWPRPWTLFPTYGKGS
jgi:hypothetical protein